MKIPTGICLGLLCIALCPSFLLSQDLAYFTAQADRHNLELETLRIAHDIALEQREESQALPDTEIGTSVFSGGPETRLGAQKARFSFRQMLPWFGNLSAKSDFANSMAAVAYQDWIVARRKLRMEVAQRYYELQNLWHQQQVITEQVALLEGLKAIALTAVETGKSSSVAVLKIAIIQNELEANKQILHTRYTARHISFFKLLNIPPFDLIFTLTALPEELPEIQAPALGPHPELEHFDKLFASVEAAEFLNRKLAVPNLGLGIDYIPVAERTDMVVENSGRDILMPMISVAVPIFNSRYKSRTVQNQLRQESIQIAQSSRKNQLEGALAEAWSAQEGAYIQYAALAENGAKIRQALDIQQVRYQSELTDFSEVLELQEMLLKLQLNRAMTLENYLSQGAIINYLTGATAQNP